MGDMPDLPDRQEKTELRAPKVLRMVERGMLVLVGCLTVIAAGPSSGRSSRAAR